MGSRKKRCPRAAAAKERSQATCYVDGIDCNVLLMHLREGYCGLACELRVEVMEPQARS